METGERGGPNLMRSRCNNMVADADDTRNGAGREQF